MPGVVLPFAPSLPNQRFGTTLDDVQYLFDVRWNERDAAWYFDLLAEDETPIRHGIKIVLGAALGGRVAAAAFPRGVLMAADTTGAGVEPGLDDLGTRVVVYFFTLAELDALG